MPDTPIQFTGSILELLETKVAAEAAHLLPIVQAIRDHGVGFLVIPQRATGLHRCWLSLRTDPALSPRTDPPGRYVCYFMLGSMV
ncbi:hypothetical protein, partial [Rhodovulum euryhalinum]